MAAYISFQPKDQFGIIKYTGDGGSSQAQTGLGFQPSFVWIMCRNAGTARTMYNSVAGSSKYLQSQTDSAEGTNTNQLVSFDSDGITVGSDTSTGVNTNTYVAWCWKGDSTTVPTGGSLTSTGANVNTTSGVSIVEYDSAGTSIAGTVAHGLGEIPTFVTIKQTNATRSWASYFSQNSAGGSSANDYYWVLNETDAQASSSTYWNNTDFTSSLIHLGTNTSVNDPGGNQHVAISFTDKNGFFKSGIYKGNGDSNGRWVYCGFRPSWIVVKRRDGTSNWMGADSERIGYNNFNRACNGLNTADAETTSGDMSTWVDFNATGFKLFTSDVDVNNSGSNYTYIAFAEQSMVSSNGVPSLAR